MHYNVEWKETKKQTWTPCGQPTERTIVVENLTYDREYVFRVNAENEVGPSDWTTTKPVKSVCPFKPPGPPPPPEPTQNDDESVTVTWEPPKDDGGSPVLRYVVERKLGTSPRWSEVSPEKQEELTLTLSDTKPGTEYIFHVAAVNEAGQGPFSEPSKPLKAKKIGE